MGGGHLMTHAEYDCDELIVLLREFRSRHPHLRLILEPGSAFTWRTGYLVSTVEDIVTNGGVHTAMLDVSFACHMPDCLGDYCGDWAFDRAPQVGDRIVFEDMIHYTMVKTTMFNGVQHPAILIARRDGSVETVREFGYEDFKSRMS